MAAFATEEGIWKSDVDGLELLARRWLPIDGPVKAIVIIAHGYMEHCGRYEKLAEKFCAKGWGVYAADHRGHGKSEDVDGLRAYFWKFDHIVSDFSNFVSKVFDAHTHNDAQPLAEVLAGCGPHDTNPAPVVPIFLLGHSMGGLCVTKFLLEHGKYKKLQGVVLSAPFLGPADHVNCLAKNTGKLCAKLLPKIGVAKIPDNAISRNLEECEKYNTDPLNTRAHVTCNVAKEFFAAHDVVLARAGEMACPVIFLQGTGDKIVSAAATEDCYNSCGSEDKILSKYDDAGHELLNELPETSDKFVAEVVTWIDKRVL